MAIVFTTKNYSELHQFRKRMTSPVSKENGTEDRFLASQSSSKIAEETFNFSSLLSILYSFKYYRNVMRNLAWTQCNPYGSEELPASIHLRYGQAILLDLPKFLFTTVWHWRHLFSFTVSSAFLVKRYRLSWQRLLDKMFLILCKYF